MLKNIRFLQCIPMCCWPEVHRGQLYSQNWNGWQEPGTSRCSRCIMARVKEFQEKNQGCD